ncbi:MAG: hypothetical protein ACLR7U_01925 [Ruthenibacterium lactatiformans]
MADVPFAFIRDMMAAALGVEAHLLRPPYKDAQEFDYRLSAFCARILITRTFSAQAPCRLEEGTVLCAQYAGAELCFHACARSKAAQRALFGPFLYEAASGPFL